MTSVALFNNKGGVGKTTLAYHLAHMVQRLGHRVLAADLDPQANLTAAFLDDDELEELWDAEHDLFPEVAQRSLLARTVGHRTIADAVSPILKGTGDIDPIKPIEINDGMYLLPGKLDLGRFEDSLSAAWPKTFTQDEAAIRTTTAFHRVIAQAAEQVDAEVVLIDIGPNLGAINRAALLAAQTVLVPLAADLFSLMGLWNLGPTLREWQHSWKKLVLPNIPADIPAPAGDMTPLGYVIMQPSVRLDRPVKAYEQWLARIPRMYSRAVLGAELPAEKARTYEIATVRNFRSLMPLAHDARKPMFDLKPADGAIGSTQRYVQTCRQEFEELAESVLQRLDDVASSR